VHRSVIGSVERAVAHLVEEHGGAFPAWIAPVQLVVLPVSDAQTEQTEKAVRRALDLGLRAELAGPERGTLGARIREARLVPYVAVVGEREAEAEGDLVAVRLRDGRRPGSVPVDELLDRIAAVVRARGAELWAAA
jgi:threonyl-tRNA synthetase